MKIFPSLPADPQLGDVFRRFPHTVPPLLDYHDRLMRDPSPLTVAQRELIAAYVSGLNSCTFCHGAHILVAEAFGLDADIFETLMTDIEQARIENPMKPILAYIRKLTLTPSRMIPADAEAVFEAGWDEQALFDAVSVCALFNFMNRIVEGSGIKSDPRHLSPEERGQFQARIAGMGPDPHRSDRRYSALMQAWGTEPPKPAVGQGS